MPGASGTGLSLYCSDTISMRQSQVDKLYTGLVDLSDERGRKITAALQMFQFTSEVRTLYC